MTTLRSLLRRTRGDDGVALLMAMTYIGMFGVLMLSMLAVVTGQVKPTAQARKDIGSLNAAATGLQAGLAALRSAVDTYGDGDRTALPCTATNVATFRTGTASASMPGASLTGQAARVPGAFTYRVDIAYFLVDPTDQTPAWLSTNRMTCLDLLTQPPKWAYLQAYGTGTNIAGAGGGSGNRGNRSQTGTYQFNVRADNVAGGRLRPFGTSLCLDAGSAPAAGTIPTFVTCTTSSLLASQSWQYRRDLTLFYGGDPGKNLCVQASSSQAPQLQRCTGTGFGSTYPYATNQQVQEWSYNDNGHFAAGASNGNVASSCLQASGTTSGASLLFQSCSSATDYTAFDPEATVGAGKAGGNTTGLPGSPTLQYVNFQEFGRCLDITNQDVTKTWLINYPCKQAPDSTNVTWNQKWFFQTLPSSTYGQFFVKKNDNDTTRYCLNAPTSGVQITVTACTTSSTSTALQWTATGEVLGSPRTSYTLVSRTRNMCMSIDPTLQLTTGWSTIVLQTCDGSNAQRWNAPPPDVTAGLTDIKEGTTPR